MGYEAGFHHPYPWLSAVKSIRIRLKDPELKFFNVTEDDMVLVGGKVTKNYEEFYELNILLRYAGDDLNNFLSGILGHVKKYLPDQVEEIEKEIRHCIADRNKVLTESNEQVENLSEILSLIEDGFNGIELELANFKNTAEESIAEIKPLIEKIKKLLQVSNQLINSLKVKYPNNPVLQQWMQQLQPLINQKNEQLTQYESAGFFEKIYAERKAKDEKKTRLKGSHFTVLSRHDFLYKSFKLSLTEESKSLYELGNNGQGYIGLVEVDTGKIHLVPSFNKGDGLLEYNKGKAVIPLDKYGKKFSRYAMTEQPLGGGAGDLHMRTASNLSLGHKAGSNGLLMGFGIWKGGRSVKFMSELPDSVVRFIPDEYILVKGKDDQWKVYYVDLERKAGEIDVNSIAGLKKELDALPNIKPEELTVTDRAKITGLLSPSTEFLPEIKFIKNRSSSQNMFSFRYSPAYSSFFSSFITRGHGAAHLATLVRELPLPVFQKIADSICTDLGIQKLDELHLSPAVPNDANDNSLRAHLDIEARWNAYMQLLERANIYSLDNCAMIGKYANGVTTVNAFGCFASLLEIGILSDKQVAQKVFEAIIKNQKVASELGVFFDELHRRRALTLEEVKQCDLDAQLYLAVDGSQAALAEQLFAKGAKLNSMFKPSHLQVAMKNENLDMVKLLIKQGVNLEEEDDNGDLPLITAVFAKNKEMVSALIDGGANKNVTYNQAPLLLLAIQINDLNIFKLLIDKGCEVSGKLLNGDTLMHMAAVFGALDIIKFLAEKQKVDIPNAQGYTPLYLASRFGFLDVVKELHARGASLNPSNLYGRMPLHTAAAAGSAEVVRYLVENGADANMRDIDGVTPLDIAYSAKNIDLAIPLMMVSTDISKVPPFDKYEVLERFIEYLEKLSDDDRDDYLSQALNGKNVMNALLSQKDSTLTVFTKSPMEILIQKYPTVIKAAETLTDTQTANKQTPTRQA